MEIERINEHTVKFYISYVDIEDRGFDREEIWYNRERSEELFWEMMDEIHHEEEFSVEGPLWIQVQALENGLEVIVTKAQVSKDGNKYELPLPGDKVKDFPVDEKIESLLDQQLNTSRQSAREMEDSLEDQLEFTIKFADFEDIIALAHRLEINNLHNSLFSFEERYYLFVQFDDEEYSEDELEDILSMLLEYGNESAVTIHRLEEYGNKIIEQKALSDIALHFPAK